MKQFEDRSLSATIIIMDVGFFPKQFYNKLDLL
jgi:hypothetical protein